MNPSDILALERYLTPEERAEYAALIEVELAERPWAPLPGPQTMAYESLADVVGFGGAAGGGKQQANGGAGKQAVHTVPSGRIRSAFIR